MYFALPTYIFQTKEKYVGTIIVYSKQLILFLKDRLLIKYRIFVLILYWFWVQHSIVYTLLAGDIGTTMY